MTKEETSNAGGDCDARTTINGSSGLGTGGDSTSGGVGRSGQYRPKGEPDGNNADAGVGDTDNNLPPPKESDPLQPKMVNNSNKEVGYVFFIFTNLITRLYYFY